VTAEYEIRADFDQTTIVVYQAFAPAIADAALASQRFVSPFSFSRMTWIKPSFLWLMHRSNWAQKSGQERILAVRISRAGWEKALGLAVLTSFETAAHRTRADWETAFAHASVYVQWDPERSLRGAALPHRSIQVGIGRSLIQEYAVEWITRIEDMTPKVSKIHSLLRSGHAEAASRQLPRENRYPITPALGRRLLIS